uniref:LOB domain-containing protein 27-like n=2 Tax=Nicotiana TaxID=4085 RepID=A0A1S3ZK39_TOBAC|nr:PREDICTED: LOB domain-containing protein 27-like isoform X2 [Nicotiana sylvestris]XP_016464746.1 PREDICTED: LOB domain-containing protein 27-like [Nicotiana tabacum]
MDLTNVTNQACAACNYGMKPCDPHCPLAPYFPADQPKTFQNVYRLFGVSKILQMLHQLDATEKKPAMQSIIYEANARQKHPVYGCVAEIRNLYFNIRLCEQELQKVREQLSLYTKQLENSSSTPGDSVSQIRSENIIPPSTCGNTLSLFTQDTHGRLQVQNQH